MTLNRREFVNFVGAGAAAIALSGEAVMAAVSGAKIQAIAFDGLAVFDVRSVAALSEQIFPGRGAEMSALWRARQFEYTWLRTLGRKYANFWQVTEEALAFSCMSLKLELTKADSDRLMQSYLELKAWPEALAVLKSMKTGGLRMAFLSNFTTAMLDQAVKTVPRIYEAMMQSLSSPSSLDPFIDLAAALRAGPKAGEGANAPQT